jgi:hypothetical protein
MKFKNEILTSADFDSVVTGLTNKYSCWSKEETTAKKYLTEGENLICIASFKDLHEGNIIRKYTHIGFYKTLEDFFLENFNSNSNIHFFFIPTDNLTNKEINNIILDVQNQNNETPLEIKLLR